MAVTTLRSTSLNPLSAAVTGGTIPAANIIINVSSWADALEPQQTPVSSRCKKGAAWDQVKEQWGQSYRLATSGSLDEALDTTETEIDLQAGEGKLLYPYAVIEIIDYIPGTTRLDYSTREEVIVLTCNDDKILTSIRGNGTGTGVSHEDDAYWAICGTAMPYNRDFSISPVVRGDQLYNHPQRFYGMVSSDVAARNTPSYEHKGDPMLADLEAETMRQKHFLERAVVSGTRLTGDAASGTSAVPYKMGGIRYFIENHSGRVHNLAGRTLSVYDLEDMLREMYKEVEDGGAKTLLMGPDTAAVWDSLFNPYKQFTNNQTDAKFHVSKFGFRWGDLEIMHTRHLPEGEILFVDFKDISLHPYKGCSWSTKTLATDGPYDRMAIWGDYGLKVERVQRMGMLTNFNFDLDAYSRREYF